MSSSPNTSRIFAIAFWCLLLLIFGVNLAYKLGLANTPAPDQGGFERNVIWGIQQVMAGNPLYQNPESEPFAVIQYMPLYYHLTAFAGRLTGVNPLQAEQVYLLARTCNLVFSLLASGLLAVMAIRIFHIRRAIALGISVVGFCLLDRFAISGRPDMLKGLLFLCLVWVLLWFPEKRKRLVYPLAVFIGFLAFFTKQDGLVFSGILPLVLLFSRRWKDLILVLLIQGGLLLSGLAVSQFLWDGQFFANVAGGLQNGLSVSWFLSNFHPFFAHYAVLFGLALVLAFEFFREENHKLLVLASAFVLAFFPPLLLVYKYGSAPNYFTEAILISLLMAGIGLQRMQKVSFFMRKESNWLMACVLIGLMFYTHMMNWGLSIFFNREDLVRKNFDNQRDMASALRAKLKPGEKVLVLSGRQWEDHFTTLLFDRVACPQRDVSIQIFNAKGKLNFQPIYQSIESGNTAWLLTEEGRQPAFLNGNFSAFRPLFSRHGFVALKRE